MLGSDGFDALPVVETLRKLRYPSIEALLERADVLNGRLTPLCKLSEDIASTSQVVSERREWINIRSLLKGCNTRCSDERLNLVTVVFGLFRLAQLMRGFQKSAQAG